MSYMMKTMLTITSILIFLVCILFSRRYHTTHFLNTPNPIENYIIHVSDKPCYSVTQKPSSYLTTGFSNYKSIRWEIEKARERERERDIEGGKVVEPLKM